MYYEIRPRKVALSEITRWIIAVGYFLIISGCGGGGNSSAPVQDNAKATAPGAPTLISITSGDGALSLTFSAPTSDGGTPINSYTATCVAQGVSKTGNSPSSPIVVSGLQNKIEYSCSVTASNIVGPGIPSASLVATPALSRTIEVTPILGGFTSGATIDIYRGDTGAKLGTGITDVDGKATIKYSSIFDGVLVVKVTGSPSSKFYDERTDTLQAFGPDKVLFSLVLPSIANQSLAAIPVTVISNAIAIGAGIDGSGTAASFVPTGGIALSAIQRATEKVITAIGLNPTKVDLFAVPAFLSPKDQGLSTKLQGNESALTVGITLIAIAKLTPGNTDLASFCQFIAISIKNDSLQKDLPSIATLPVVYDSLLRTVVASASQRLITTTLSPGASPWDSGSWDSAFWY